MLLAMLVVYGALLAAIGPDARLPGSVWTVCVVWICAQAAGFLVCKVCLDSCSCSSLHILVHVMSPKSQGVNMPAPMQVGLPPVVGMVGIGLLLRNIPGGVLRVSSHAAWCALRLHYA